jgi:hypothetical protein
MTRRPTDGRQPGQSEEPEREERSTIGLRNRGSEVRILPNAPREAPPCGVSCFEAMSDPSAPTITPTVPVPPLALQEDLATRERQRHELVALMDAWMASDHPEEPDWEPTRIARFRTR